jgi:hypothetical protein
MVFRTAPGRACRSRDPDGIRLKILVVESVPCREQEERQAKGTRGRVVVEAPCPAAGSNAIHVPDERERELIRSSDKVVRAFASFTRRRSTSGNHPHT